MKQTSKSLRIRFNGSEWKQFRVICACLHYSVTLDLPSNLCMLALFGYSGSTVSEPMPLTRKYNPLFNGVFQPKSRIMYFRVPATTLPP